MTGFPKAVRGIVEKRADGVVHNDGNTMCARHGVQGWQIRNIEQRIAGKFAEDAGDFLLIEQFGQR